MTISPLVLDPRTVAALGGCLPVVAERAVDAIAVGVTEYADRMTGPFRSGVEDAVQLALGGFLRLGEHGPVTDGTPLKPVLDAAYGLGRGEARSGRTMSGLLAAYRVGARVAWQEWSAVCVGLGMPSDAMARFAELVFSYIDALSAASVTGHSDQLAVTGQVREQYRERLARAVLDGEPEERLRALADRSEWPAPECLTAVVVRASDARTLQAMLGPDTLFLPGDLAGLSEVAGQEQGVRADVGVLLAGGTDRRALLDALRPGPAVVGPTRPWTAGAVSLRRAARLLARHGLRREVVDSDEHLAELVVCADDAALADLRARALAPLAGQRAAAGDALVETLRSWLLHQGRREAVAADLHVHPQTVRYRMTRLRELFGDALTDPRSVLELTVALAVPPG